MYADFSPPFFYTFKRRCGVTDLTSDEEERQSPHSFKRRTNQFDPRPPESAPRVRCQTVNFWTVSDWSRDVRQGVQWDVTRCILTFPEQFSILMAVEVDELLSPCVRKRPHP